MRLRLYDILELWSLGMTERTTKKNLQLAYLQQPDTFWVLPQMEAAGGQPLHLLLCPCEWRQ